MITITSTATTVTVDMGVYYTNKAVPFKRGFWRKDQIHYIFENTDHVEIDASDKNDWILAFDSGGVGQRYQVATIDGAAPTSNSDLFDKLTALIS